MNRLRLLAIAAVLVTSTAFAQVLNWRQLPGAANDIAIGPRGEAWVIGTDKVPGGFGIYRLDGGNWTKIPGGAKRIAVGPQGPWVTNSEGGIYRWDGKGSWEKLPGAAWDIGVGANGVAWVIGTNKEEGGYGIYRWNGKNNWEKVPGSALRVAVDPAGFAWVVNKQGAIFRWVGMMFTQLPGTAVDVGIGANGAIYIVGMDQGVYQWTGMKWLKRDGTFESISVDHQGQPWGVNAKKEIFTAASAGGTGSSPPGNDVTARLENLGIANETRFANRLFARNPWDMKAYRGKVYIGSGNSNNSGPDTNAGPVDVTYYDPATSKFGSEWQVNDEQIDLFRIVGGTLSIPGHDPRENWTKGNFYRRVADGKWQEMRTVDWAIHMYDIAERSESAPRTLGTVDQTGFSTRYLAAAIGTPTGGEVALSMDGGKSWKTQSLAQWPGARARTFLSTPSALCLSVHTNPNIPVVSLGNAVPFSKSTWLVTSKGASVIWVDLFPGMAVQHMFAAKSETFNGESYYFGAYAPIDHNWKSEGMFATRDCTSARAVRVPGKWFHHVLADGGKLYVVTSDEEAGGRRSRLFASTDGSNFKEVFSFTNKGFARSFAILNGDFYFGIGCEAEAQHAETGRILRLRAADLPK